MPTETHLRRTTVELDREALARAQEALGTRNIRDTIDMALREVDRHTALRRAAEGVLQGGFNLITPEDLAILRSSRA